MRFFAFIGFSFVCWSAVAAGIVLASAWEAWAYDVTLWDAIFVESWKH